MAFMALLQNIERLFFGLGSWLCRISLFGSVRVRVRDFHLVLDTQWLRSLVLVLFFTLLTVLLLLSPVDNVTLCIVGIAN